jgi:hypothetical protein
MKFSLFFRFILLPGFKVFFKGIKPEKHVLGR